MPTINTIIKELREVPVNRLDELYQFVHSLTPNTKQKESVRRKILSFGGVFGDMTNSDYSDFIHQTKNARTNLFDRGIDL